MTADVRRAGEHALLLLAAAVVVACIGLGAPPRMEVAEGAPRLVRLALDALLPLALVQVLTLLAAARLAVSGALLGTRGARRALLPLAAVLVLGLAQLAFGATAWTYGTWVAVAQVAALIASGAAVLAACGGPGRVVCARRVLTFVAVLAAAECAYGIVATHLGADTILGFGKVSSLGRVTGTFVMPSVLATLGALGACAALALAADAWHEGRLGVAAVWGAVLAICGAGVVLSLSRWMLAAAGGGLVVTAWLAGGVLWRGGRRGTGGALRGVAVLVPVAGLAAAALVPALRARFEFLLPYLRGESGPIEPRFAGWLSTWDLFRANPAFGSGLGSFGRAIHRVQSVDAPDELWYAHSEPLNVLADIGVLGFALMAAWILVLVVRGRRALRSPDVGCALLAAGAAGGSVAALVAGLADFPTQFAPVAIPFAAFLALPAALAARPEGAPNGGAAGAGHEAPGRRKLRRALAAALILSTTLPLAALAARWAHVADGHAPGASYGERLLVLGREQLAGLAAAGSPTEAERRAAQAALVLAEAAREEPGLDETHLWLGLAHVTALQLTTSVDEAAARRDAALAAFAAARRVSRGHADVNLQIGLLYLDLLGTARNPHGPGDDTAMDALREAGALVPQAFSRAWREALARELPLEALRDVVPDRDHAQRGWARHLRSVGRGAEADAVLARLDRRPSSRR